MIRSGPTDDRNGLDRRRFGLGLMTASAGLRVGVLGAGVLGAGTLGSAILSAGAARAQGQPPLDPTTTTTGAEPAPDPAALEAALLANLFTRMSVRTRINGRGPYDFVVDTGASRTAVSQELAAELGLPTGPEVMVHGVTSAAAARTVHVARLEAAGRRFTDIEPCVFPRSALAADGLMGLDVLSRFELELDLAGRTMMLTPSGPDRISFGRAFCAPSRLKRFEGAQSRRGRFGQLILLNARVEGVSANCFVDSGAQYSIGNSALQRAVGERQGRSADPGAVQVYGVTGQVLEAQPGLVSQLEINRHRLGPTRLLFADLHAFRILDLGDRPALLLGADVLSRFSRVSLDFGGARMSFSGLRRSRTPSAA